MTTARETHHPIAAPPDVEMQLDSTAGVNPNPGTHRLIDRVLEVLCAALLAAITLILFANAVMRFAFNSPLGWTEELVTGMMLWLTMLGFTLGVRRRESIEIRAFVGRLPVRIQTWLKLGTELLTAGSCCTWPGSPTCTSPSSVVTPVRTCGCPRGSSSLRCPSGRRWPH